ncbi:pyridoxal phosphate-dependent aminotransferase [Mesorhizobium sp. VK24D]|uniref:Aminotransferase n=1 Tax=Mesorhizobium album TaxID=3072314 RepID=A0ABU4Y4I0_9HYPH|nr:pyridoxal phosphate-dependent aminotransferase [Mesorhizobium sp. VK24D]MDX8481849.1 pyridoxal phosphate-dependent aminotransferase [Mesorhizobium sp. VK24D]
MGKLSRRADEIRPSPTIGMNMRAEELRRSGRDVIPLSLGEPDFHTPENVKAAGIAAIQKDFTKYTATEGYRALREALAAKLKKDNGLNFTWDQIVVSTSAKIVIYSAFLSILDQGDEVIIPAPFWVSYPDLVGLAGGVPKIVPCSDQANFKLTADQLQKAITPKTKALVFNSPNNPSGAIYTASEIKELAAVLAKHPDIWVVTDELYEHIVYDNHKANSFASIATEMADRVITINGFSKGYVMTGWRLGFVAADKRVIKPMADFISQMQGSPSSISQAAALEALTGDQSFMAKNRTTFQARRDLVVEQANRIKGLSALRPSGSFYAYINCDGWIGKTTAEGRLLATDLDVAEGLLMEASVAIVPGTVFGLSPYFRISYSLEVNLIKEAMRRIAEFADGLR